jgi:hypothetical protein
VCVSLRLHGAPPGRHLRCHTGALLLHPRPPVEVRPLLGGTVGAMPELSSPLLPQPRPAAVVRPALGGTRGAIQWLSPAKPLRGKQGNLLRPSVAAEAEAFDTAVAAGKAGCAAIDCCRVRAWQARRESLRETEAARAAVQLRSPCIIAAARLPAQLYTAASTGALFMPLMQYRTAPM